MDLQAAAGSATSPGNSKLCPQESQDCLGAAGAGLSSRALVLPGPQLFKKHWWGMWETAEVIARSLLILEDKRKDVAAKGLDKCKDECSVLHET